MALRHRLRAILTNPITSLLIGLVMVGTGVSELVEAFDSAMVASSAHGVVLYGLVQAGKGVIELLEGLEKVEGPEAP